jgi:hypothetical protein
MHNVDAAPPLDVLREFSHRHKVHVRRRAEEVGQTLITSSL